MARFRLALPMPHRRGRRFASPPIDHPKATSRTGHGPQDGGSFFFQVREMGVDQMSVLRHIAIELDEP